MNIYYIMMRPVGEEEIIPKFICAESLTEVFERYRNRDFSFFAVEDITNIPVEERCYEGKYAL